MVNSTTIKLSKSPTIHITPSRRGPECGVCRRVVLGGGPITLRAGASHGEISRHDDENPWAETSETERGGSHAGFLPGHRRRVLVLRGAPDDPAGLRPRGHRFIPPQPPAGRGTQAV